MKMRQTCSGHFPYAFLEQVGFSPQTVNGHDSLTNNFFYGLFLCVLHFLLFDTQEVDFFQSAIELIFIYVTAETLVFYCGTSAEISE